MEQVCKKTGRLCVIVAGRLIRGNTRVTYHQQANKAQNRLTSARRNTAKPTMTGQRKPVRRRRTRLIEKDFVRVKLPQYVWHFFSFLFSMQFAIKFGIKTVDSFKIK